MKAIFNFAMAALAVIVMASCGNGITKIEGENLPLEEALKAFEEGKTLIASLEKELKEAEEKVTKSLKGSDED